MRLNPRCAAEGKRWHALEDLPGLTHLHPPAGPALPAGRRAVDGVRGAPIDLTWPFIEDGGASVIADGAL
jgi:hypothetical protein